MKKTTRLCAAFFALLLLCTCFVLPVAADTLPAAVDYPYEDIDPSVKIHDRAGLFDKTDAQALEERAQSFVQTYGLDIAVVTVREATSENMAMRLADDIYDYAGGTVAENGQHGFADDGLLLLIDMTNRKYWISTKGEGIRIFYDSDIDWLKELVKEDLSDEDPRAAAETFLKAAEEVVSYAKQDTEKPPVDYYTYPGNAVVSGTKRTVGWFFSKRSGLILMIALVGSVLVGLCYYSSGKKKHKPVRVASEANSYVSMPLTLQRKEDTFLTRHVSRVRIQSESSGGGGGGGSSHSSSSGGSHGGGGGSF